MLLDMHVVSVIATVAVANFCTKQKRLDKIKKSAKIESIKWGVPLEGITKKGEKL